MNSDLYVVEAELITLKSTSIPQGPLLATLRVGRANISSTFHNSHNTDHLAMNLLLQLNVDSSCLENQRCTITLSRQDKSIVGIALISLPKHPGEIKSSYKLNQAQDKKSQLSLRIRIAAIESSPGSKINPETSNDLLQPMLNKKQSKQIQPSTINKAKSTITKVFDQEDHVQILESQLARLKREKDVYYQLYQLEKNKSQVAAKFIAKFVERIIKQYPELASLVQKEKVVFGEKNRPKDGPNKQDCQALEQANRSLHRQIQEYKKINQQLRNQLCKNTPAVKSNNLLAPGGIDDLFPNTKSNIKARNSNILSSIKSQIQAPSPFTEVDLKKWLQESVGQREQLQKWLLSLPKDTKNISSPNINLSKVRASINKSYVALMSKGTFNRESILAHKRDINSILDELFVN